MQPLPKGYIYRQNVRGVAGRLSGQGFQIFRAPLAPSARSAGGNFSNASASADFERPCWAKNGTNSGTAKSPRSNILHSSPYLFCHVLIGNLQNATKSVMKQIEHMYSGHVQAEGKCYISRCDLPTLCQTSGSNSWQQKSSNTFAGCRWPSLRRKFRSVAHESPCPSAAQLPSL